jgi:nucleotide-binding universal stress UspA family protein
MRDESGTALVAYDGSEDAAEAIRRAGPLLAPRKAVVVRVWDSLAALLLHTDLEGLSESTREAAEELDADDARDAAHQAEEGAQLAASAGFEATPLAVRGRPKAWPAILREADGIDAAVIVAGCRGLGGVKSALLGSVSSGLLRHSHRPLLVVPPAEDDGAPGPVIVGYDGSAPSRAAVSGAARLLSVRAAIVETVWIAYTPVAGAGTAGAPVPVITRAAERIDQEIAVGARKTAEEGTRLATAARLEARAEPTQAAGAVWRTLIHSAREHRAAAVVVGSRGRSAMGAVLLGSVSTALVHHAPVPVLVVPDAAPDRG